MFGMKGFYVSASGAIQDHHGPLVMVCNFMLSVRLNFVGQLVLDSGVYLSYCHQSYLA